MAKVFKVNDWLSNHPNRNNFDLTHKVHGSYKMGVLYPFLCKPVVPGDSFRITNECSFRFTPMPFPTQSNMRVLFHYFYVRNKNIWSGFENWIEELEEHEPPYVVFTDKEQLRNGSLADYLDIPTSYFVPATRTPMTVQLAYTPILQDGHMANLEKQSSITVLDASSISPVIGDVLGDYIDNYANYETGQSWMMLYPSLDSLDYGDELVDSFKIAHGAFNSSFALDKSVCGVYAVAEDGVILAKAQFVTDGVAEEGYYNYNLNRSWVGSLNGKHYSLVLSFLINNGVSLSPAPDSPWLISGFKYTKVSSAKSLSLVDLGVAVPYYNTFTTNVDNPIKVSALPFRAVESIYNAFYRDQHGVQPFKIDGVDQFNKYNTTTADGADTTDYHLFRHNWEMDAYTSCLLSPMQGETPLVGVSSFDVDSLGRMSVELDDGSTGSIQLRDLEDGQQGVAYESVNATSDAARNFLLRTASMGFSIPDFRQVNAYTRWKEMNLRKGARYLDFIKGHFGTSPKYKELDMPEFLGGFTQRVSVNDISNTNGVDNDQLGAIAGQARAIGGSKHGVNHFFDDYGFIVGMMCIVPDNAYDSVLPKHYLQRNPLDMYFPEFSQLSLQPLTHEELCPIQTVNDPRGSSYQDLTKVFGYQRPNHDLVWSCDTVHGLFRDATGIGNSVICRRFAQRPELGTDFLQIKSQETDTIFNYTFGDEDICLGEIVVKIQAKRPVPYLVVPSIS